MRRGFTRWVLAATMAAAGAAGGPGAVHALGGTPSGQFTLHADGTNVALNLAPGVYAITVRGVYNYDNVRPGLHFADAECSNDHVLSRELVDFFAHDGLGIGYGSLYPSPLSEWQRYRYTVSLADPNHTPFWTGEPQDDTLDVYVDGQPGLWVPLQPTPVEAGPGVDAGCDSATHTYTTVIAGGRHDVAIFDTNLSDNADVNGGLTATISRLL